jgi:hypothetical protein
MDRIKQKALIGRGVLMRVDIFLFRQRDQHLARRLLAEVERHPLHPSCGIPFSRPRLALE